MEMFDVLDEVKLDLTGGLLELEIEDVTLEAIVNKCLREIERYWDETTFITVPFASCIDLTKTNLEASTIVKVRRAEGLARTDNEAMSDPLYMQQFAIFSNAGTMLNLSDYLLNYAAYTTIGQIQNTMSSDLSFTMDKHANKLYINGAMSRPSRLTIEYIPKLKYVSDIKSEYWQDVLIKMVLAQTKIILGRIRTRFTQSNALWTMDGDKLLEEGTTDLKELRELLRTNDNLIQYGMD